jgi:hypothetical protein
MSDKAQVLKEMASGIGPVDMAACLAGAAAIPEAKRLAARVAELEAALADRRTELADARWRVAELEAALEVARQQEQIHADNCAEAEAALAGPAPEPDVELSLTQPKIKTSIKDGVIQCIHPYEPLPGVQSFTLKATGPAQEGGAL